MTKHYRSSEADEYFFKEGCHVLEYYNQADDTQVSVARIRVAAQSDTKLHKLSVDERYLILSGSGLATIDDEEFIVQQGDVLRIAAGCAQKIRNTGDADLVFLAICTPSFTVDAYQQLEP